MLFDSSPYGLRQNEYVQQVLFYDEANDVNEFLEKLLNAVSNNTNEKENEEFYR